MESISVVLATFNEEENIGACLESVKNLADEIVVVDGGSTDITVAIAKKHGARVEVASNPPIFHINKQKAIDLASKDWVLQLDADERVTPELAKEIKSTIEQSSNATINGYWIPRKNFFLGRFLMKGGQYPDYTLRLYRRGKGSLPQKSVHEQAVVAGETGYLHSPLIHMADKSLSRYLLRFGRYTDLLAVELKDKKIGYNLVMVVEYLFFLPAWWFLKTYIRHKGFMDSWQGFLFSFFSSLRFTIAYIKYIKKL